MTLPPDDRCEEVVPGDLPWSHAPPSLVGARCECCPHEYGSHRAEVDGEWVVWKDSQLVDSSTYRNAMNESVALDCEKSCDCCGDSARWPFASAERCQCGRVYTRYSHCGGYAAAQGDCMKCERHGHR